MCRPGLPPTAFVVVLIATVLVLTLAPAPTLAAEGKEKQPEAKDKDKDKASAAPPAAKMVSPYAAAARAARERKAGGVITTEDLEQRYTGAAGFSSFNDDLEGVVAPAGPNPTAYLATVDGEEAARAQARSQAQAELDIARHAIEELEKQLLALRNPFAARAVVSDEEREARAKDPSVKASIARIDQELSVARAALALAERRAAGSAPSPGAAAPEPEPPR